MNIDDAIRAHAEWKNRLRRAIETNEKLDADTIGRDDQCDLGRWLKSGGCPPGPARDELVAAHTDFHRGVAAIVRQANAGQRDEALRALAPFMTEFAAKTTRVIRALSALKTHAA